MFPMPDQFAVLVNFLDTVKGNLVNCPIRSGGAEEKMVAWGNVNVAQRNPVNCSVHPVIIPNLEISLSE